MADTANTNTNAWLPALKAAFPLTIPICLGFLFLGASYGILMGTKGFSFVCRVKIGYGICHIFTGFISQRLNTLILFWNR